MTRFPHAILVFTAVLLCIAMLLPACAPTGAPAKTDPSTAPVTDLPNIDENAKITTENLQGALIVYPENADASLAEAAKALQSAISEKFGIRVNTMVDYFKAFNPEKSVKKYEILIGATNREESNTFIASLPYLNHGWGMVGNKIAICGGTDEATVEAVNEFIDTLTPDETVFYRASSDHICHTDFTYMLPDLMLGSRPISDYAILYQGDSGSILWQMAGSLRDTIGRLTGHFLPMMSTSLAETLGVSENRTALLLGAQFGTGRSLIGSLDLGEASYRLTDDSSTTQLALCGLDFYTVEMALDAFFAAYLDETGNVTQPAANETVWIRTADDYSATDPIYVGEYPVGTVTVAGHDLSLYRIVYSESDFSTAKEAAESLAIYLEKACGVKLPVVSDSVPADTTHEIVVGTTNRDTEAVRERRAKLQNDGVMYYMEGDRLYLSSHTAFGTNVAVFQFLEEKLGWRYYTNTPVTDTCRPCEHVEIPADLDESFVPPFYYRRVSWYATTEWNNRLGGNSYIAPYAIVGFCHTMEGLAGVPQTAQPCLTDETVYQTVLANLRKWIEENPSSRVFSVTQNDNQEYCTCENCTAFAEEEGQSGIMLSFVNRLYDDLKDAYPDIYLLTFAYEYTRQPPKTIRASDHVIIWLCSIECCFSHTLTDPDCPENVAFRRDIEAWQAYADYLYIWDYTTNYSAYSVPFPDLFTARENAAFFADNHAIGLFEEGESIQIDNGEFSILRGYLLQHLAWNPYLSEEDYSILMDEFLEDYYGKGWKYVRYYIELSSRIAANKHMYIFTFDADDYMGGSGVSYDHLVNLWERAISLAEDETTRNHCRYSSIQARLLQSNQVINRELYDLMHEAKIYQIMQNVDLKPPVD